MANKTLTNTEVAEELQEIQHQFEELLEQAHRLLRHEAPGAYNAARGYWLASLKMALCNEHEFLGRDGYTMQDTINELALAAEQEAEGAVPS